MRTILKRLKHLERRRELVTVNYEARAILLTRLNAIAERMRPPLLPPDPRPTVEVEAVAGMGSGTLGSVEEWSVREGAKLMIIGAHVIVYSKDAAADRSFFREVLGFPCVDAGHGWLIFALPPAEVAIHPAEEGEQHELYFMCDDLKAEISALGKKGVRCWEVQEARWGSITKIRLPGGSEVGLYQPKHPTAFPLTSN